MRYSVFGPRELRREVYTNKEHIAKCLAQIDDLDHMICGGGQGVESLAERYADEHGIPKTRIPPNFRSVGGVQITVSQAFETRNLEMLVASDAAIVFWDTVFPAIIPIIQRALTMTKPVRLFPLY